MAVQVGGVSIGVGVDVSQIAQGVEKSKTLLAQFQRAMKDIRLEGSIKGDPFKATNKYINKARSGLNRVFNDWKRDIEDVDELMNNWAVRARQNAEKITEGYEKARKKFDLLKNSQRILTKASTQVEFPGVDKETGKEYAGGINLTKFTETITKLQGYNKKVDKLIGEMFSALATGGVKTKKELEDKYFNKIQEEIEKGGDKVLKKFASFGTKLEKGFSKQKTYEFRSPLKQAKSMEFALENLRKETEKFLIAEAELQTKIKAGIAPEQNRIKLLNLYNQATKTGITLTTQQARELDKLNTSLYAKQRTAKLGGISIDKTGVAVAQAPREQINAATQANAPLREQAKLIAKIKLENRDSLRAIEKGIQIEKNREILLKNINKLKELGYRLSNKELLAEKQIEGSLKVQKALQFKEELTKAGSTNKILSERNERLKQLTVAQKKLDTQRKLGINLDTYQANSMKILQERQSLGIRLTKEQTRTLKNFSKAQEKASQRGGFLTKEWFLFRAGWFIQLRVFWELYRKLGEAIQSAAEYQIQLSRALRTARSDFMNITQIAKEYSKVMREAVVKHNAEWQTVGEALYQLTSAGLSSEEAMAALNSTLSLVVGTEGDVRETTKAVASLYNVFGSSIKEATTETEKFEYINGVIAKTWENYQVEMNQLIQAYQRASSVVKAVGVDFKDFSVLLGVSAKNMIPVNQAGREFVSVFSRIAREPKTFAEAFDVKIDTRKPLKFLDIMKQISERFKSGAVNVDQLTDAFSRMGIRGARTFITLLQNWKDVEQGLKNYIKVGKDYEEIERRQLDNLAKQWERLGKAISGYFAQAIDQLDWIKNAIKKVADVITTMGTPLYREILRLNELKDKLREAQNESTMASEVTLPPNTTYINKLKKQIEDQEKLVYGLQDKYRKENAKKELDWQEHENKRLRKYTVKEASEAEKEYWRTRKDVGKKQRIGYIDEQLSSLIKQRKAEQEDLDRAKLTGGGGIGQIYKRMTDLNKKINSLMQERKRINKEINSEIKKQLVDSLTLKKEEAQIGIRTINSKLKELAVGQGSLENEKEINKLQNKRKNLQDNVAKIDARIATVQKVTTEAQMKLVYKNLELGQKQNEQELQIARSSTERLVVQIKLNRLIDIYNKKLDYQKQGLEIAKRDHATKLEINALERKSLDTQKDLLEKELKIEKNTKDTEERRRRIASLNSKIRDINLDIIKAEEEHNRLSSILYGWTQKVKDGMKEWHDVAVDALTTFTTGFATGLGDTFADLTGGFQEQQQQAEDLKGQLSELGKEYKNAVTEGDIERTKEIADQMANLKDQISDLEDPVHNLGEAFRSFFKDLIDQIRKTILEWLALQAVMGIVGAFTPPSIGFGSSKAISTYGGGSFMARSDGGILPNIKSFRRFSRGGITNSPTMALLGDNMSKKEIVIPTENIKSDNVSGYMRNSGGGDTYIINAITERDFAEAMSRTQGQNVIVNTVLKHKEPISKILRNS